MFTGIITDKAEILDRAAMQDGARFRIGTAYDPATIEIGASIACSGPCLTVVQTGRSGTRNWFDVEVSSETLSRTTVNTWQVGTALNLERSLTLGGELGGHVVTGHVDGVATITGKETVGDYTAFKIEAPKDLARFIAEKGSVTLDGTSLTVNGVDGNLFDIMLIPHTMAVTTWNELGPGDRINIEVDLMARYAARLMEYSG